MKEIIFTKCFEVSKWQQTRRELIHRTELVRGVLKGRSIERKGHGYTGKGSDVELYTSEIIINYITNHNK